MTCTGLHTQLKAELRRGPQHLSASPEVGTGKTPPATAPPPPGPHLQPDPVLPRTVALSQTPAAGTGAKRLRIKGTPTPQGCPLGGTGKRDREGEWAETGNETLGGKRQKSGRGWGWGVGGRRGIRVLRAPPAMLTVGPPAPLSLQPGLTCLLCGPLCSLCLAPHLDDLSGLQPRLPMRSPLLPPGGTGTCPVSGTELGAGDTVTSKILTVPAFEEWPSGQGARSTQAATLPGGKQRG